MSKKIYLRTFEDLGTPEKLKHGFVAEVCDDGDQVLLRSKKRKAKKTAIADVMRQAKARGWVEGS